MLRQQKSEKKNISKSTVKPNIDRQLAPYCSGKRPQRWKSSRNTTSEAESGPWWKSRVLTREYHKNSATN